MADTLGVPGATGRTVAANIERERKHARLTFADLSRRLDRIGQPIATLGLSRIEKGKRRVDADDLVAIARALNVSPITLLMPQTDDPAEKLDTTVAAGVPASRFWDWLTTAKPFHTDDLTDQWRLVWFGRPVWARPDTFSFTEGAPPQAPAPTTQPGMDPDSHWVDSADRYGND